MDALEDEIERLMEAFEAEEMPFPRTKQNVTRFEARMEELRKKLRIAQGALKKCREANPLPAD